MADQKQGSWLDGPGDMPTFSQSSLSKLSTCDSRLQVVFFEVIKHVDCTILDGHRNQWEQNRAFFSGASTKQWPDSKHNRLPSFAVDAAPYPINWGNTGTPAERASAIARFRMFSGFVLGVGFAKGIPLRSGGDWDMDFDLADQKFIDLPHFELAGVE